MTRLICIGDCHFGPQAGRNEDRYRSLDQIIQYGLQLDHLGAWLLAGDLNHAKMTIEDRNALADRLQAMANRAPVLAIRGNHDVEGDVEIFTKLQAAHAIVYRSTPGVVSLPLATGGTVAVFCLPYVFKGGLVSAGVEHSDLGAQARALLDPVFIAAAADLAARFEAGENGLVLGHMNIGGALMSSGQPSIGAEIELDPALLARFSDDVPKIFGHIHKHQRVHGAYYLGSIARMDFAEREAKCFGVLTFTDEAWRIDFVPLDVPAMHLVEGRLTRDTFTISAIDNEPVDGAGSHAWAGTDVKCRYEQKKSEVGVLDVAKVLVEFAGCRSLKLDPVTVLEHTVRAPEIAAAVTLEQKVEAYAIRVGIPFTDGLREKVSLLQGQPAEAVLAHVRARLDDPAPDDVDVAEVAL